MYNYNSASKNKLSPRNCRLNSPASPRYTSPIKSSSKSLLRPQKFVKFQEFSPGLRKADDLKLCLKSLYQEIKYNCSQSTSKASSNILRPNKLQTGSSSESPFKSEILPKISQKRTHKRTNWSLEYDKKVIEPSNHLRIKGKITIDSLLASMKKRHQAALELRSKPSIKHIRSGTNITPHEISNTYGFNAMINPNLNNSHNSHTNLQWNEGKYGVSSNPPSRDQTPTKEASETFIKPIKNEYISKLNLSMDSQASLVNFSNANDVANQKSNIFIKVNAHSVSPRSRYNNSPVLSGILKTIKERQQSSNGSIRLDHYN
ncbi:unnamed protein product [Blepharisma stoltei]|uniref:Uncharacterized protein n=1 Tax=Blepharisma stoltei TaxID=1481888 RepID=A0AAU9JLJ8_9CILI|nr:unnamed protein product [Blepharisma stoltei]